MFSTTFRHESWRVRITFCETDESKVTYFANEGLAQLAVEWAYAAHVETLRRRGDVSDVKETVDPSSGGWKLQDTYGKKVTWWKNTPAGFVGMKDYFTADRDVIKREVLE